VNVAQRLGNPVLVEITRADLVESFHSGAAAVVHAQGQLLEAWGDVQRPIYARSAIKPIQALPLIETGAADHFKLGEIEIALACASHSGERQHIDAVANWLGRVGLSSDDLECGSHSPLDVEAAESLICQGQSPSALHNNCSGKHAGFLTTALHLGDPVRGYVRADHPVQCRVKAALAEMTDSELDNAPMGIDGCGIPVIGLSLCAMALGMARLGRAEVLTGARADAAQKIVNAMIHEPFMVAGTHRICTDVIRATRGDAVIKTGAEGVFAGVLPRLGVGVAVKIDDGSSGAAEVAIVSLLRYLKVLDKTVVEILAERLDPVVRNHAGVIVGKRHAARGWLGLESALSTEFS